MSSDRRDVTRDFIFYLRLCKDPMLVFPLDSIFCTKASDWLYYLAEYECHTLEMKRLRNQYLARLVACLDAEVLIAPFLEQTGGQLTELRKYEPSTCMDTACEANNYCDRHRGYILNPVKRQAMDEAMQRLEIKRNISQTSFGMNVEKAVMPKANKDETITQLRSIKSTLSDLTLQTQRLSEAIEPGVVDNGNCPKNKTRHSARKPNSIRRTQSDLSQKDLPAYRNILSLSGQKNESSRDNFSSSFDDPLQKHAATQRSLSPFTQDFINRYKYDGTGGVSEPKHDHDKQCHKLKESKARMVLKDGIQQQQKQKHCHHPHCQQQHQGCNHQASGDSICTHVSSNSTKASVYQNKSHDQLKQQHNHHSPKTYDKPWFLETDRTLSLHEKHATTTELPAVIWPNAPNFHNCNVSVYPIQISPRDLCSHKSNERLHAGSLQLPAEINIHHAYGDCCGRVPVFERSISDLSMSCSELNDGISNAPYRDFNEEMADFAAENLYNELPFCFNLDPEVQRTLQLAENSQTQAEPLAPKHLFDQLTLLCHKCFKNEQELGICKQTELSPLPNLETIIQDSSIKIEDLQLYCSSCLKANPIDLLFFKKNDQTGKFSKFTLGGLPPRCCNKSSPARASNKSKTQPNPQSCVEPVTSKSPPREQPPATPVSPTPTAIKNSSTPTTPTVDGDATPTANMAKSITDEERKRVKYLLDCIAKERSGSVKPWSNKYLERNIYRFLTFISQFDNKSKEIEQMHCDAHARQRILDMMTMDLQKVLNVSKSRRST